MNIKHLFLALAALAMLAGCKHQNAPQTPKNYVVYGKIYTAAMNPEAQSDADRYPMAEAMVIKDGKYVFVGSKADAQQFVTSDMEVIDRTGKGMIIPGMTDGHAHYLMQQSLPMFAENSIKFSNTDTYETVLAKVSAMVREAERNKRKLDFIYGEGYDYTNWPKRNYRDLDTITAEIPMFLASYDQHSCWCNSATMINAGIIDKEGRVLRSEIRGGIVDMDEQGTIYGVFYERATSLLLTKGLRHMHLTPTQALMAVERAQRYLHSVGFTNVLCGWSTYFGNEDASFYQALAAKDGKHELKLNYALAYEIEPYFADFMNYVDSAAALKGKYDQYPHILPNYIKLFADGTVEGGTGCLLQDYVPFPASPIPGAYQGKGMPVWSEDELAEFARKANAKGIAIHVHTMGDGAVHNACEGIKKGGLRSVRNALCHIRNVGEADYQTIKDCNIAAAAAMNWHNQDKDAHETFRKMLPLYYADNSYPLKSFFDRGILMSSATDTPAHDGVNYPFHILEVAVTGKALPEQDPWCPDELITRQQALQALTYNGAWQLGLEKERGSIEVGKCADFVIIDQDVLTCPAADIHNTKVLSTFFEGEQVFGK